jgi:FAS-associated factor 2
MVDAELDIGQLTEDQQLALQQFTSVTDQEIKDAIPLLQRCQWNVQVCHELSRSDKFKAD